MRAYVSAPRCVSSLESASTRNDADDRKKNPIFLFRDRSTKFGDSF